MTEKLLKRVIDNAKNPGTLDFAPLTSDPLFGLFKGGIEVPGSDPLFS